VTWATRRATARRVVRRLLSIAAGLTVLSFLGLLVEHQWLGAAIAAVIVAGLVTLRIGSGRTPGAAAAPAPGRHPGPPSGGR
jgi:hypothetical protein